MMTTAARWTTVALLLAVSACPAFAEDLKLWPKGAPGAKGTEKTDIPTLKVFPAPTGVAGPAPAVLLIPGGGYKHISGYGTVWNVFKDQPVRFFSMKYRLPVHGYRHPAPLQDAQRAVCTIRANAKKWNIDPKRVVVVAFSSGGHVATTLATHYHLGKKNAPDPIDRVSCRPDVMVLYCPVISMITKPHRPSVVRLLGPNPDKKLLEEVSNELKVNAKTPPTLLIHAKDDGLVPPENSINYHAALKKVGVQTVLKIYPEGGHGVTRPTNPWIKDTRDFLRQHKILPPAKADGTEKPKDKTPSPKTRT